MASASVLGIDLPKPAAARSLPSIIVAAAGVLLVSHLLLLLNRGINWDEFHQFDHVRQYAAGTLTTPVQTFHVHLFGWLLDIPGDATVQIRAGRLVSLASLAGIALAIFAIAARFASRQAAALTAMAWLSGGHVIYHGTAFRADPLAAALLMGALWVLFCLRLDRRKAVLAGAISALAAIVTIKSVFYAPAFAAAAWMRWNAGDGGRKTLPAFLIAGTTGLLGFVALYLLHAWSLPAASEAAGSRDVALAGQTVFSAGFLPQWEALKAQVRLAPHLALLLLFAPIVWIEQRIAMARILTLLGLLLPLATVLFYRNAFPYFYVFILPPAVIAVAPVFDRLPKWISREVLAVGLALYGLSAAINQPRALLDGQREVIATVDRMFPQPVTYFDHAGSLGSHKRAMRFMPSGWGLEDYRRQGRPQFIEAMQRETIPLLITNHPVLGAAMDGGTPAERLLDADALALHSSYLPYSGRIHIAGKRFPAGVEAIDETFLVPGTYRLITGSITIDGTALQRSGTVTLARGVHRIAGDRGTEAVLRWGPNLPEPPPPPVETPAFEGL